MTLITDNLTKGNRENIESALIGGQLNGMVGVLKLFLNQRPLLFTKNARISIFGK